MSKFYEGQVVRLKSGSTEMTVQGYCKNLLYTLEHTLKKIKTKEPEFSDYVICTWFEGESPKRENFHEDSLELVR